MPPICVRLVFALFRIPIMNLGWGEENVVWYWATYYTLQRAFVMCTLTPTPPPSYTYIRTTAVVSVSGKLATLTRMLSTHCSIRLGVCLQRWHLSETMQEDLRALRGCWAGRHSCCSGGRHCSCMAVRYLYWSRTCIKQWADADLWSDERAQRAQQTVHTKGIARTLCFRVCTDINTIHLLIEKLAHLPSLYTRTITCQSNVITNSRTTYRSMCSHAYTKRKYDPQTVRAPT